MIAMTADQLIVVDTDYCLTVAITGNPTSVEVTGDMEYFDYDWQAANNRVLIKGHPEKEFSGVWNIKASYSSGDPLTEDVNFSVIAAAPIFGTLPDIHLYRGVPINIDIPITNPPSSVVAKTLLLGLGAAVNETGVKVDGEIPEDNVFSVSEGTMMFEAPHVGGAVMGSFGYDIEAGSPAAIGAVTQTLKGNFAVAEFTDVQHAIEYEWGIDNGEGIDFLNWNRFGNNRATIDLENLTVTPGNLEATVTFPHVSGATRYEWIKEGGENWVGFAAAPVNNMISTIIPDLTEGETVRVYFRVASPWIGVPVSVQIVGGRFCYICDTHGSSKSIHIFHTGVPNGGVADRIKRILMPSGIDTIQGLAVRGDFAYILNQSSTAADEGIWVFNHKTATDGAVATQTKKNPMHASTSSLFRGLAHDGTYLYFGASVSGVGNDLWRVSPDLTDGTTLTAIGALPNYPANESGDISVAGNNLYFLNNITQNPDLIQLGDKATQASSFIRQNGPATGRLFKGTTAINDSVGLETLDGQNFYILRATINQIARHKANADNSSLNEEWAISIPGGIQIEQYISIPS